ncbi:MAG: hypothetical protein K6356_06190 [Chloroflexus sp.]
MKVARHLIIICAIVLISGVATAQPAVNRAGVVVRFGNGEVVTACIEFSEPSISGLELLERSGLPVISQQSSIGVAVCKIGRDGCDYPATSCFCAREQGRVVYWAFYRREAGSWRYSNLGASNVRVNDGDVHGWAWGPGDASSGAMPPELELADICQPATITLSPTATIAPTATATPVAAIVPTATATPVVATVLTTTATAAPVTANVPTATAAPVTATIAIATPTVTNPPLATVTPLPTATMTPFPAMTVSADPTNVSAVTPTSVASVPTGNAGQWLSFAVLVALLIGGIAMSLKRRR